MPEHHSVGLDVSVKKTAICIVNAEGEAVHQSTVESDPSVIAKTLVGLGLKLSRIGLEAGSLFSWLYAGLVAKGLPAICVELATYMPCSQPG